MLDFDTAVDLIKQYGYTSTTSHPYIYQTEDSLGLCYQYVDEEYGTLERVKTFKTFEELDLFLKQLEWLKTNGVTKHVRMILNNYEAIAPKIMFLRNEKLMVEGEMFEIENFDLRESQRNMMDDVSKVIYEAGDLLLVYDEMKGRQLQYLMNIIKLKNSLRQKYYDLQKEVDEYNKFRVNREIKLLPEIADSGINETLEIALKDKYNMYIAERPPYDEACDFLREVWELCKSLELNIKYYDAQKEENDVHNELKIVNQKLELMNKLNDEGRPLFGIDLAGNFRRINKVCMSESTSISQEWIDEQVDNIERKYAVLDSIDILNTSDYLREAIQNSNYADLALKYANTDSNQVAKSRTPLNEVAANLSTMYSTKLTIQEQAVLVLYNNQQFRKIFDAILKINDFETIPIKKLIGMISKIKDYSKIKTIIFDNVKKRLNDPSNDSIKASLFSSYDFSSYESFISSIVQSLVLLKNINAKMLLSGDINMYSMINKVNDVTTNRFVNVTNALNDLLIKTKDNNSMIAIVLLKEYTPVLYSPYYLDIGDVYTKGASLQMFIKEMSDFELLIDTTDVIVNIDPKQTNVARYYSEPKPVDDVCIVTDIKLNYKTTFCKFAFTSPIKGKEMQEMNKKIDTIQAASIEERKNHVEEIALPENTQFVEKDIQSISDGNTDNVSAMNTLPNQSLEKESVVNIPVKPSTNEVVSQTNQVTVESNSNSVLPKQQKVDSNTLEQQKNIKSNVQPSVENNIDVSKTAVNNNTLNNTQINSQIPKVDQPHNNISVKKDEVSSNNVGVNNKEQVTQPMVSKTPTVSSQSKPIGHRVLKPGEKIVTKIVDGKEVKVIVRTVTKPVTNSPKVESKKEEGTLVNNNHNEVKKVSTDNKVNSVYGNMELPADKKVEPKEKMVATPLPVPKVLNPTKKQVVVQSVGQSLKKDGNVPINNVTNKENNGSDKK